MSQILLSTCRCAVCGGESRQRVLASTNTFGSPDLDLRPAEMERSTMPVWIQSCPHCGYVATELKDPTGVDQSFLNGETYRNTSGLSFSSPLARKFYQGYLIALADGGTEKAFRAALHAAWACDDEGDGDNAAHCRRLAVAELDKITEHPHMATLRLQRADLLRRAGAFDAVIRDYGNADLRDERLNKILAFQLEKARLGDAACYTVAEACS